MYLKQIIFLTILLTANQVTARPASTSGQLTPEKEVKEIPTFVSQLPQCQGYEPQKWDACVGAFVFPNKNSYFGEWRKGERDGVGQLKVMAKGESKYAFIRSDMPAIYVGQFKRGQLNGHGVWIDQNGDRYEGEFKANLLVFERKDGATVFGDDSDKLKKKCESYGLKFGTSEFAQCMVKFEQLANQNQQKQADREHQKEVQRISKESTSIDWFRLASEFAKPPQFMPEPCDGGMLLPPGQRSNCR